MTVRARRLLRIPLFVLPLALLVTSCAAITMSARIGFDGSAKPWVWTPVSVSLGNTSEDNITGVLGVAQEDQGDGALPTCGTRVTLPGRSRKVYNAYIWLGEYGGKVRVILRQDNGAELTREINIDPVPAEDRLIVSAGPRASRLSFLAQESIPRSTQPGATPAGSAVPSIIHVGSIDPARLPDRPGAYSGVDVLVFPDSAASAATPSSLKALRMWIAGGGALVVPAGANYRGYTGEFFDDVLPVTVTGTANLPGLNCLAVMGKSQFPAGPVSVVKSAVKPGLGRVLAAEAGLPIVVERSYGAGRVVFIAVDHLSPPFRDWGGQVAFWKSIISSGGDGPLVAQSPSSLSDEREVNEFYDQERVLAGLVMQNPSVRTPSFNTIGLFLLAYLVVLVPVNYAMLKRRKRLEMAWVTTPAIVLFFTVGAYAIGYTMKGGDLQIREATVIQGSSNARFAHVISTASLFSPARRSYDISVADDYSLGRVLPAERGENAPRAELGEEPGIKDVGMAMWSSKTFESAGGVDLGGCVRSKLNVDGGRVTGEIVNDTKLTLSRCWLCYGSQRQRIGDLTPGASVTVDVKHKPGNRHYDSGNTDQPVADRLLGFVTNRASGANAPILVATAADRDETFGVQGYSPSVDSGACYVFRLDARAQGAFTIDPSTVTWRILGFRNASPNASPVESQPTVSIAAGGSVTLAYHLPVPANGAVTSLSLKRFSGGPGGGANNTVAVALRNNATGRWEPVTAFGRPIPNAGRYVDPNGDVRISATLDRGRADYFYVQLSAAGTAR